MPAIRVTELVLEKRKERNGRGIRTFRGIYVRLYQVSEANLEGSGLPKSSSDTSISERP